MKKRIIIYIAGILLLATQNVFATVIAYAITNDISSPEKLLAMEKRGFLLAVASSLGFNLKFQGIRYLLQTRT